MSPRPVSAALLVAASLLGSGARAAEVPVLPVALSVTSEDLGIRLRFMQASLEDGQVGAKAWWYSWMAGYTALAVGQLAPAVAMRNAGSPSARELRINLYVGAASAAAAAVATGVVPLSSMHAGDKCSGLAADDPLKQVLAAEGLLFEAGDGEQLGRSWIMHVITVAVGVVSGLVLWLGYGYLLDGALSLLGNVALGELQIWTQPMRAADDAGLYRRSFGSLGDSGKGDAPTLHLSAFGPGLAVSLTF